MQGIVPYNNGEVLIRYARDLKRKEVVTQMEGTKLGYVSGALVDVRSMTVQAVKLKPRADLWANNQQGAWCVPEGDVCMVGDVVLVAEERSLRPEPRNRAFVDLIGMTVRDLRGMDIGRICELEFNPETGEIRSLFFDEFGLPDLPLLPTIELFNLYGFPVEAIDQVQSDSIVIDQRYQWLDSVGKLNPASRALLNVLGLGRDLAPAKQKSKATRDWEQATGMTVEQWYSTYAGRYADQTPTPRRLPVPRETAYDQRVQREAAQNYPSETAPVRPTRRGDAQPSGYPMQQVRQPAEQRGRARQYDGIDKPVRARQQSANGSRRPVQSTQQEQSIQPTPEARPVFDDVVVRDNRERMYESMQEGPRRRQANDAVDPRDPSMQ